MIINSGLRFLCSALLISTVCGAQHQKGAEEKLNELIIRKELFFQDSLYEFGLIEPTLRMNRAFKLINNTRDTITIDSVASSCECGSGHATKKTLLPGEQGYITARVNMDGKEGEVFVSLQVFIANRQNPLVCYIHGEVATKK